MIDFDLGVALDTINKDDLPLLRGWRNQRSIWRWCRQFDLITEHDQEHWHEATSRDRSVRLYKIMLGQLPVGVCGLSSIDPVNRRAEFSIYISPDYQKSGHATAALKTLLSHGFRNLNLHLIWGESFDGNPAQIIFERLGMTRDGRRRDFYFRNGQFIDAHLFSITEREWNHQQISLPSSTSRSRPLSLD